MSQAQNAPPAPEIIYLRRSGGGGEDAHHGGVWKIAFADFMTAMMAFFLVMWLVNASNESTKVQVASYFNPVKLTDTTASKKGINEPGKRAGGEDEAAADEKDAGSKTKKKPEEANPVQKPEMEKKIYEEGQLFADPYAVLTDIAGDVGQGQPIVAAARDGEQSLGLEGGDAFRDPFDPLVWKNTAGADIDDLLDEEEFEQELAKQNLADGIGVKKKQSAGGKEKPNQPVADEPGVKAKTEPAEPQSKAEQLEKRLTQQAQGLRDSPQISVEQTKDGLLVNLTDGTNFSMFETASAQPNPDLIRLIDRIAPILKTRPGKIIIRGHTDARPFRTKTYDNWRLSTARAHIAYHMLVRGGLAAQRIIRIEGSADRAPLLPDDPNAAANRRIELLLLENS